MTRRNGLGTIVGVMLILPLAHLVAADVYIWTDEKGVVNFSNSSSPPGVKTTSIHTGGGFQPVPLEVDDRSANRKLVRVELQGTRENAETRMIVDTGAQKTMIDGVLAKEIGVHFMHNTLIGGVTGVGVGAVVEVPRLRIGSAELHDVEVMVGPTRGVSLLGMDVLDRLELSVGQNSLYRSSR